MIPPTDHDFQGSVNSEVVIMYPDHAPYNVAPKIAKLMPITRTTGTYGRYICSFHGILDQLTTGGAPPCMRIAFFLGAYWAQFQIEVVCTGHTGLEILRVYQPDIWIIA